MLPTLPPSLNLSKTNIIFSVLSLVLITGTLGSVLYAYNANQTVDSTINTSAQQIASGAFANCTGSEVQLLLREEADHLPITVTCGSFTASSGTTEKLSISTSKNNTIQPYLKGRQPQFSNLTSKETTPTPTHSTTTTTVPTVRNQGTTTSSTTTPATIKAATPTQAQSQPASTSTPASIMLADYFINSNNQVCEYQVSYTPTGNQNISSINCLNTSFKASSMAYTYDSNGKLYIIALSTTGTLEFYNNGVWGAYSSIVFNSINIKSSFIKDGSIYFSFDGSVKSGSSDTRFIAQMNASGNTLDSFNITY